MPTDTTERGLEELIVRSMTGRTVLVPAHVAIETSVPVAGGTGWLLGDAAHYDREYCVDLLHRCLRPRSQDTGGEQRRPSDRGPNFIAKNIAESVCRAITSRSATPLLPDTAQEGGPLLRDLWSPSISRCSTS